MNTPGEAGGRRKIGTDKGSPRTGDGHTRGARIKGSDVTFQSAGGNVQATGAGRISRLRAAFLGGKHRSGK